MNSLHNIISVLQLSSCSDHVELQDPVVVVIAYIYPVISQEYYHQTRLSILRIPLDSCNHYEVPLRTFHPLQLRTRNRRVLRGTSTRLHVLTRTGIRRRT